jgi:Asp-tRNA(Asn)/Glu-tRNA(Gln) amidotransferase C subunit
MEPSECGKLTTKNMEYTKMEDIARMMDDSDELNYGKRPRGTKRLEKQDPERKDEGEPTPEERQEKSDAVREDI